MIKLKKFRQSIGLSQEKLARQMDITLSYYSQVERGYVLPSRGFIVKLKKLYPEINVNEMFFNDEMLARED